MTTFIKIIISILVTLLLLSSCTKDDQDTLLRDPTGITSSAELSAYLEAIVEQENVPGFAISIVKDDALVYQEAFGYANIADQVAYTNQTITQIASVSKTFVGAAVAKAIEQGYFSLETDIDDLLPVSITNPNQPDSPIKIKHLVTHTSGLLDIPQVYLANNYYILPGEDTSTTGARMLMENLGMEQREGYALSDFLAEYFLEDGAMYHLDNFAHSVPGTSWSYSNLATGLTGLVIESVTGQSFDTYVKENILQPLQMNASTYAIAEVNPDKMATAYINDATPLPFYANDSYPEGGLYSTNEDMGKYLLDMVKGVNGASSTLFSTAGYANLLNAHLDDGIVPAEFADNHGLFWYMKDDKVMHSGNDLGVSTHLELHGNDNSGYLFLSNIDASFTGNMQQYHSIFSKIDMAIGQFLQAD